MMPDRVFTMDLTPVGHMACVLLDGIDISHMLRGVRVTCIVGEATQVELIPARGQRVNLTATVTVPNVIIGEEP
jgi:hypothetical protein